MSQNRPGSNPRLVAIALLAGLILLALVVATGGGFPGTSSSPPPAPPTPEVAAPTVPPNAYIRGVVTLHIAHLGGHAYRYLYTLRNTGTVPIAGFQINAPRSNLFHIRTRRGWTYYGAGICGGNYAGVLVYWSTGPVGATPIPPGHAGRFGFDVNTTGTTSAQYSVSWTTYAVFSTTQAPAGSSLTASGPCS